MKIIQFYLLALICLSTLAGLILSCNDDYDFTYETIVTDIPVNIEKLNTQFDDYNSALPYAAFRHGIYYSTNSESNGNNFDIIYRELDISYHSKDDLIDISFVSLQNTYHQLEDALKEMKSLHDEFGPYSYWGDADYEYFFYANDEAGNFDIKYVDQKKADASIYNINNAYTSLNSDYDDMYPCISENDIYFCSNRENDVFNIYSTNFVENEINPDFSAVVNHTIEMNDVLSSSQNDKCPYIHEDMIVFTSDRDGGFGGYDLYYAESVNGVWGEPINFGDKINSEFDEYRPIIVPFYEFEETMLIFSSNRDGGKGGFDLYSVRADI